MHGLVSRLCLLQLKTLHQLSQTTMEVPQMAPKREHSIPERQVGEALFNLEHLAYARDLFNKYVQMYPGSIGGGDEHSQRQTFGARLQELGKTGKKNKDRKFKDSLNWITFEPRPGRYLWCLTNTGKEYLLNRHGNSQESTLKSRQEGEAKCKIHLSRERSSKLIHKFKSLLDSYSCSLCGFNFEQTYGAVGREFIEAHHLIPISDGVRITKLADLIALCSNCHQMAHRHPFHTVAELRSFYVDRLHLTPPPTPP